MNSLIKIRVNFKRENVLEDVNMSLLCDYLIENLTDESKEELKKCNNDFSKAKIQLKITTKINT